MISVEMNIPKLNDVIDQLNKQNGEIQKALDRTTKDCKNRAPAQITKAVTAVYAIKSGEVAAAGKSAKLGAKTIGEIKIKSGHVSSIQLTYSGRRLTPLHFSMVPKLKPVGKKKYTVKSTIFKGQKKVLKGKYNTPIFLAPQRQGVVLPFQRIEKDKRMPIYAIHTVGIPQMIDNEIVAEDIHARIEELFIKRLQHHVDQVVKNK